MSLFTLPESTYPGGKCLDGTQAGYYFEEGKQTSLVVIHLEGGGYCNTESYCEMKTDSALGSTNLWSATKEQNREESPFLDKNCNNNPDFCEANHIFVPYCTGDTHTGTRHENLDESFGMYFDGKLNFQAIVKKLIAEHGMGDAENVLLTGSSAGGIGVYFNVDWLAEQVPDANVKAVPLAGWFFPRSLEEQDSPEYLPPDDYPHFADGIQGNDMIDMANTTSRTLWQVEADPICAQNEIKHPESCAMIHVMYKYIRSPIFAVQNQFDGEHIFFEFKAPIVVTGFDEINMVEDYLKMYGGASRQSLEQIIDGNSLSPKPHRDGLFAPSCILHEMDPEFLIDDMDYVTLVHDWFFQINQYESQHQMIETCSKGDESLPCNKHTYPLSCHYALDLHPGTPVSPAQGTRDFSENTYSGEDDLPLVVEEEEEESLLAEAEEDDSSGFEKMIVTIFGFAICAMLFVIMKREIRSRKANNHDLAEVKESFSMDKEII